MTANITLAVVAGALVACGVYLLTARGIVRALLGVLLMGNGINLLFLVASGEPGHPPIVGSPTDDESQMSDPLPQALVLTAIVITLAMTAFVMALAYRSTLVTRSDTITDDTEDTKVRERAEHHDHDPDDVDTILEPDSDETGADPDSPDPAHDSSCDPSERVANPADSAVGAATRAPQAPPGERDDEVTDMREREHGVPESPEHPHHPSTDDITHGPPKGEVR